MNTLARESETSTALKISHIVKGQVDDDFQTEYTSGGLNFITPPLRLKELTWSRLEPPPAAHLKINEIVDLLEAVGKAVRLDTGGHMSKAIGQLQATGNYKGALLRRMYDDLAEHFNPAMIYAQLQSEFGGADVLDGWRDVGLPSSRGRIRAFPARLVHVLAGNAPAVAPMTIVRGAITKSMSLLKLASNDLFTVPAMLRVMADIAPDHPIVRSFSAVYWRGGDTRVEGALFRSQYFDKLVAWGGDAAIKGTTQYLGPGFELISFDPKTSISMIGRETFASEEMVQEAADLAASDATAFNQEACSSSRVQFVEGTIGEADRFCEALLPRLSVERENADAIGPAVPKELRDEIAALKPLEPDFRVWGKPDGSGMVVRSDGDPVDFYPSFRVVNVVRVDDLKDAFEFVNLATQGVGIYPAERKAGLRDALAFAGVQNISVLGHGMRFVAGGSHDGMFPLQRFVRWADDKD